MRGKKSDTVLIGRVTYQMFERHWPHAWENPNATELERKTASELDAMTKIVFSKTLQKVIWVKSKLVEVDPVDEVRRLKRENGSDMIIFSSGTIIQQLTAEELIDNYFILVTPVILGAGKTMFVGNQRLSLKMLEVRSFESENVLMHYRTDR